MSRTYSIYEIASPSGKRYVGVTYDPKKRRGEHFRSLRRRDHHCTALQAAFVKYGEDMLVFRTLSSGWEETEVLWEEARLIAQDKSVGRSYNAALGTGKGMIRHSEETRAKMAAAARGRGHSEETRAKLSAARQRRVLTTQTRERISRTLKGRKFSTETRRKLSLAQQGSRGRWIVLYSDGVTRVFSGIRTASREMGLAGLAYALKAGIPCCGWWVRYLDAQIP
jgi:group I intron endonuclease